MRIWRIIPARHRVVALLGHGARRVGGRWNPPGLSIGYCSESAELAVLELIMHTGPNFVPEKRLLLQFELPRRAVSTLRKLPSKWDSPELSPHVQKVGADWLSSGKSLALRVPSAVLPLRSNVLVSPNHPRFREIREISAEPFTWSARLQAHLSKSAAVDFNGHRNKRAKPTHE